MPGRALAVGPAGFEPGAWLHGHLYPQRCDVSPDGELLAYFALSSGSSWSAGDTYVAISRLPWLRSLVAWGTSGTWTRGVHFTDRGEWSLPAPDEGDASGLRERYGLATTRADSFSVERRRGWTETAATPARSPTDMWDEGRSHIELRKVRPGGGPDLIVGGQFAAFRSGPAGEANECSYRLATSSASSALEGVQWADWAADGRLLTMTHDGRLQTRLASGAGSTVTWERDVVGPLPGPQPQPPPPMATRWPWERT